MTYSCPHPYADTDFDGTPVEISFPMAVELEISFGEFTATEDNRDFFVLCKDDNCLENWGNYSGSNFPGVNSSPSLFILGSVFYMQFSSGVNSNNLWGYSMTVTPLYGMI